MIRQLLRHGAGRAHLVTWVRSGAGGCRGCLVPAEAQRLGPLPLRPQRWQDALHASEHGYAARAGAHPAGGDAKPAMASEAGTLAVT